MIGDQLARALEKRRALGFPSAVTNAFRLVHGAGDDIEGLTVDVYDRHLVANLYTDERGAREEAWLDALAELGFAGVYLKHRPRQANELAEHERKERAPEHAVRGDDAPDPLLVRESGIPYEVQLGDGLSTGLFLDQRDNRLRVRAHADEKRVLNLFAYTCAFGVSAALGGAASTTNIDVSKGVLERGRRNYEIAGVTLSSQHQFFARDVLETLPRLQRRGEEFDLICLDPPSYASTKRGRFSVERDYGELVALALGVLAEGGVLLACTNHQRMTERDVERAIVAGCGRAQRTLRELTFVAPPTDHPSAKGRTPHLKSAWIQL